MAVKGGNWEMSDAEFERQYAEATQRGRAETAAGAYAVAVRYDKAAQRMVVELANGVSLLVPVRLIRGLQVATAKELAEIEILGAGSGLYWPQLAVDVSVNGLLQGNFGAGNQSTALPDACLHGGTQRQPSNLLGKKTAGAGMAARKRSRVA